MTVSNIRASKTDVTLNQPSVAGSSSRINCYCLLMYCKKSTSSKLTKVSLNIYQSTCTYISPRVHNGKGECLTAYSPSDMCV